MRHHRQRQASAHSQRRRDVRRQRRCRHRPRNQRSGVDLIKLFTDVIYAFSLQARVFLPGKPFQSSLCKVVTNIRLRWIYLPGTNTQAYYEYL